MRTPLPRPARRRFAMLLLVSVLALGACSDPGELGGPSVGGALAAKVGDVRVTNADLEAETDLWASSPEFLRAIDPSRLADPGVPGRRTSALVAFVLSHRVVSEQARALAEINDYEPSAEEVDGILDSLGQTFGGAFAGLPESFRRQLAVDLAYQGNLQVLGVGTQDVPEIAVEINPRYGIARDVGGGLIQVDPPEGPAPDPTLASLFGG